MVTPLLKKKQWLSMIMLFCMHSFAEAQLLSFPTAEGAGKYVFGGRGTVSVAPKIFEVTSLVDNATAGTTPGTFRYACTNNSPSAPNRIIVFRVSGTIHLASALSLNRANTTIAGQTAPGEGICIADWPVIIGANNMIIRYIRFRLGDKNQNLGMVNGSGDSDAFGDNGGGRSNIIIDHCSVSWSSDEALTIYKGDNVTLQWNFITEPLNYSYHFETGDADFEQHAFGGIQSGKHLSVHHNLFAHCKGRMPRFDGIRNIATDSVDFRNNVLYNWGDYNVNGGEGGAYNVVNNYYKWGPSTPNTSTSGINRRNMIINPFDQASPAIPYGHYYLTGNYCENSTTISNANWKGAAFAGGTLADSVNSKVLVPFNCVNINMSTPQEAYSKVLQTAGTSLPNRDTLDQRISNDVINRTGKLIDVQGGYPHGTAYATSQTAWPALATGFTPTDTDHDGMPDTWEDQRGLNKNSAADMNSYIATTGYNNVETYLNGDTITAPGTLNTCITVKSINANNGGGYLYARDTIYGYWNSPQYLVSTDTNNIVAAILNNGDFGHFNISYYTCSATRMDVNNHPYLNRNITMTADTPVTSAVTVKFYFTVTEYNALKLADPSINSLADLVILKVADNSCVTALNAVPLVIAPSSYGSFGSYNTGYYLEFSTTSFSTFFIGSKISFPIPVKLTVFKAMNYSQSVKTSWTTENELSVEGYTVERSTNGRDYNSLGTVTATNRPGIGNYSFTDTDPVEGLSYYRLKMADRDGSYSYSTVVKISRNEQKELSIRPNPVNSMLTVLHPAATNSDMILIISSDGKIVLDHKPGLLAKRSVINVSSLARGSYEIVFKGSLLQKVAKFIKK